MKFREFYTSLTRVDFDHINKAMFEDLRDQEVFKLNRLKQVMESQIKGINVSEKIEKFKNEFFKAELLMTNEELETKGFFEKYPHLK